MENLFILICELGPFTFIIAIHIGPQPFYNYREYFLRVSCGQNLPYKLACCLLFPFKLTVLIFFWSLPQAHLFWYFRRLLVNLVMLEKV